MTVWRNGGYCKTMWLDSDCFHCLIWYFLSGNSFVKFGTLMNVSIPIHYPPVGITAHLLFHFLTSPLPPANVQPSLKHGEFTCHSTSNAICVVMYVPMYVHTLVVGCVALHPSSINSLLWNCVLL